MCVEYGKDMMSYFASSSSYLNTLLVSAFTVSQNCCYIDGKDKRLLKLEQIGSTFSHYDAMLANLNISAS